MQPNPRYEHVYAIVRLDDFQGLEVPPQNRITIKKIVRSCDQARTEVERLNKLNAEKGCQYFWQVTRLEKEQLESDSLDAASATEASAPKE